MTDNFDHTPGPWDHDWKYIVAPDPAGVHPEIYIAELAEEDEEDRVASDDQIAANGCLIAAAPELFEALQTAISAMNAVPSFGTGVSHPDKPGLDLTSYELLPRLEAVLRNARGT